MPRLRSRRLRFVRTRRSRRAVFSLRPGLAVRRASRLRYFRRRAPVGSPSRDLLVQCRQELRSFLPSESPVLDWIISDSGVTRGIWQRAPERVADSWTWRRCDIVENSGYGGEISYSG